MTMQGRMWRVVVVLVGVLCIGGVTSAQAQAPGRPGDSIQVHGHWTIDIRGVDGRLASHYEFENALQPQGKALLSYLVTNGSSILTWDIRLRSSAADATGPCAASATNDTSCYIVGPGSALPAQMPDAPNVFSTGAFTRTAAGTLEIAGNATAASAQSIGYVESIAEATGLPIATFSARDLPTPIQVVAGQTVYVKVVISFGESDHSGGGGAGGDSDGDGVADALDPCPNQANPFIDGVGYCPATTYDVNNGVVPSGANVALNNVLVMGATATTITVAIVSGDPGYQGDGSAALAVQLNGVPAPPAMSRVNVLGTVLGPGSVSAVSITVN